MILTGELQRKTRTRLDDLDLSVEEDVVDLQPVMLPSLRYMMNDLPNLLMFIYESQIKDTSRIVAALRTTLDLWPTLRSVAINSEEGDPIFVILRNNERYWKSAIGTPIELQNIDSLTSLRVPGNHRKGEVPRGLLFKATIFKIIDSEKVAVAFLVNHVVCDAITLIQWYESFEACLMGHTVGELVPYSLFSQVYRSHIQSLTAKEATTFHVKRLQGIGALKNSLWPPIETPKNKITHSSDGEKAIERSLEAVESYTIFKHLRLRRIPMMPKFGAQYGIRPSIIVKAAIAIVSYIATGTKAAMLLQVLVGRSWPFVGHEMASQLPDPNKIAGPTLASAVDIVKIGKGETLGKVLQRLQTAAKTRDGNS